MRHFACGCAEDGSERCAEHERWLCHRIPADPYDPSLHEWLISKGECPPCFVARLRSVSLSPKAVPTRRGKLA